MSGPVGSGLPAATTPPSNPPAPANGRVVIADQAGTVLRFQGRSWRLDVPLPKGAAVQLELGPPGADGVRAGRLLAAAGQRLESPRPVRATPLDPGSAPRAAAPSSADRPPADPTGRTTSSPTRPAGVEVAVRLVTADGRAQGPSFPVRLSVPASAAMPRPAAAAGATPERPSPAPVTTASSRSDSSPRLPRPPTAGPPAPGPAPAAATAEVVRQGPPGTTWLQAAGRLLEVTTPLTLPIGARLTLRLPAGSSWPAADAPDDPGARAPQAADPARTVASSPSANADAGTGVKPDRTLAGQLLRLIAALPAGETDAEAVGDGSPRSAAAGTPRAPEGAANGWRLVVLPLATPEAGALHLHLRDDPEPDPDREGDRPTTPDRRRAVFEVGFSALGRCRLDAFCQGRRFDLIIRTEQPLPPDLRTEIRVLFEAARALGGMTGELGFRAAGLQPLTAPRVPDRRITV